MQKEQNNWWEIPESEYKFKHTKSSGPGGQSVNKTSSARQLIWNIKASKTFSEKEKQRIKSKLGGYINKENELILKAQDSRSGKENKQQAIARLNELVNKALIVPKKRIKTKPKKSAKEKRLQEKKKRSEIKRLRKPLKIE